VRRVGLFLWPNRAWDGHSGSLSVGFMVSESKARLAGRVLSCHPSASLLRSGRKGGRGNLPLAAHVTRLCPQPRAWRTRLTRPRRLGREANVMANDSTDGVILVARLLLAALFLVFGWRKLVDYSGTVSRMVEDGAPLPALSAVIAIFMELPVTFAVAVGAFTRPSAVLLALYTLGAALIAHRYWTVTSANKVDNMESFYKNLSIMGGFLLLYVTGAGRYSIDAFYGIAAP
jgi:putative oxidoreductase